MKALLILAGAGLVLVAGIVNLYGIAVLWLAAGLPLWKLAALCATQIILAGTGKLLAAIGEKL